jgi:hypothetical protein
MGYVVDPCCGSHEQYPFLKVSLDGWNEELRIPVEIKVPNRDDHQSALDNQVPTKYEPQVFHQLLVTQAPQLHYVSYSNYFDPPNDFKIVVVKSDPLVLQALLEAELEFWWHVENNVEPSTAEPARLSRLSPKAVTDEKKTQRKPRKRVK